MGARFGETRKVRDEMSRTYIVVVDDEAAVLEIVARDLAEFEVYFPVDTAGDAESARELVSDIYAKGDRIALVLCDHIMPGENGVEFLVWLQEQKFGKGIRKVLLTGQAGLDATVKALNEAGLAKYIAKPWSAEDMKQVVRQQLSEYVLEAGVDALPLLSVLDVEVMGKAMRRGLIGDA